MLDTITDDALNALDGEFDGYTFPTGNGMGGGDFVRSFEARVTASIAARHVFYNNSSWDNEDPLANEQDDPAIAADKTALLPGRIATLENYTNYDKGINGIMVDIEGLADAAGLNTADDFIFRVGNNGNPDSWAIAPEPRYIDVRPTAGEGSSDRVTLIWEDNTIRNQWLQVTVTKTDNTGLAKDDIFYFGNAPGEAGDQSINTIVNATDEIAARNSQHGMTNQALIADPYDYNRDKLVNGTDQIIARQNQTNPLTMLRLIAAPGIDAIAKQATELEVLNSEIPAADLDWLYEFEQMNTKDDRPKRWSVEEAVDMLLATDSV